MAGSRTRSTTYQTEEAANAWILAGRELLDRSGLPEVGLTVPDLPGKNC